MWFIPYDTIQNNIERPHPATFPVKLPDMCIKLHGVRNKNISVLDPFCGIGSTAVACKRLGVSFAGFDIDRGYLNEAVKRVISEEQVRDNLERDRIQNVGSSLTTLDLFP